MFCDLIPFFTDGQKAQSIINFRHLIKEKKRKEKDNFWRNDGKNFFFFAV